MRVALTGASGFIGGALCRRLVASGFEVVCLLRSPRPPVAGVRIVQGSLQDAEAVAECVAGAQVCVHLASSSGPSLANADIVSDLEVNLRGGVSLIHACVEASVRRFVLISSGGTVYGPTKQVPIPEGALLSPLNAYGAVKAALETYLGVYHHKFGIQRRVLRLSNPFGPSQASSKGQGVIPIFMDLVRGNRPIEIWGDGSAVRDYLYIDDVIAAIVMVLSDEGSEHTFNIGSGVGRDLNQVISSIERIAGRRAEVRYKPARSEDVRVNILDCSRARTALGWQPEVAFEVGMERTWAGRVDSA